MTAPLPPGRVRTARAGRRFEYIDRSADDDTAMRARFARFGDDANLAPAPSQFRADHDADMRDPEYRQAYETQTAELAQAAVADNAGEESCPNGCRDGWLIASTGSGSASRPCPRRCGWPATSPGAQADEFRSVSLGAVRHVSDPSPIVTAAKERARVAVAAHRNRMADDGRTEELRAVIAGVIRERVAIEKWRSIDLADVLIAGPLAPLLAAATTGRGDDGAVQRVVAALLESDALTGNSEGTPDIYTVAADDVPHLVRVVLNAAAET